VLRRIDLSAHPVLARLGPDLLADDVDFARIVQRPRRSDARTIADLLLDQRVACRIGNAYKSGLLFLGRVHPWTPPAALSDEQIEALFRTARALMLRNLGDWKRTTVAEVRPEQQWPRELPRVFVYGRSGEPCLRCRGPIASRKQGEAAHDVLGARAARSLRYNLHRHLEEFYRPKREAPPIASRCESDWKTLVAVLLIRIEWGRSPQSAKPL
jgi:formamidopyrimidine-DNA glycosylase